MGTVLISRKPSTANSFSIFTKRKPTRGFGFNSSHLMAKTANRQQAVNNNKAPGYDLSQVSMRPQAKLTVNQPGDAYEQEADKVAQQVVQLQQKSQQGEEEEEKLQTKSLGNGITPVIQRAKSSKKSKGSKASGSKNNSKKVESPKESPKQKEKAPEVETGNKQKTDKNEFDNKKGTTKDKQKAKDKPDKKTRNEKSKENKQKDENRHKMLAKQAISELEKTDGETKDYKTLRKEKEAQAKKIEKSYTKKLKKGIKLTVHFEDAAKEKEAKKLDFKVVIAPNTTIMPGSIAGLLNHPSRYVGLYQNRFMLLPKYQNKKFTRDKCYGKDYRTQVKNWKKNMLATSINQGGIAHPQHPNYYIYNGQPYKNSGNTKATIDHSPMVVQHWNRHGYDTNQADRTNFFNGINHLSIIPLFLNSSQGASAGLNYRYDVGMNFRGPKE